MTTIRH